MTGTIFGHPNRKPPRESENQKFAGPAAQRRVRSCLKLLFNWFSLIIVPPRGAWASEVPAPSPRHPRAIPAPSPRHSLSKLTFYPPRSFSSFFCRPGGLKKICLPPSVADRLPHTFPDASGAHFGTNFGLENALFLIFCWSRRSSFWGWFFTQCWLRVSSEIRLLRALREKGAYGLRPTKPLDLQDFCMCAAPPATQQGRQQRTINRIEKGSKQT